MALRKAIRGAAREGREEAALERALARVPETIAKPVSGAAHLAKKKTVRKLNRKGASVTYNGKKKSNQKRY